MVSANEATALVMVEIRDVHRAFERLLRLLARSRAMAVLGGTEPVGGIGLA